MKPVDPHSAHSLVGRQLGAHHVLARVGAGGMGEVYRARDTRLGREVALKVLPPTFAQDPDRVARFAREARLLAALTHPHIAVLYGLEEHAGRHALVMELVEGPTLSERLLQGPLRVAEFIAIATQLTDALDAAHEKKPTSAPVVSRFSRGLAQDAGFVQTARSLIAVAPDGRSLVYAAGTRLYRRAFDELDAEYASERGIPYLQLTPEELRREIENSKSL